MAGGAGDLLLGELDALGRLSGPGAAQLAADLDYFCNVLAALGVALSPPLLTWQARTPPSHQRRTHLRPNGLITLY